MFMGRYRVRLVIPVVLVFVLPPLALADDKLDSKTTLPLIAKKQAEAVAAFEREIIGWQIDYEVKAYDRDEKVVRQVNYSQRHSPTGLSLFTQKSLVDTESRSGANDIATGRNSSYTFSLTKDPGASKWALQRAEPGSQPKANPVKEANASRYGYAFFARHFYNAKGKLYGDVFANPQFSVRACSASPLGNGWVRVDGEVQGGGVSEAGWWDFDPALGYCCRANEIKTTYTGKTKEQSYFTFERHDYAATSREGGLVTLDRDGFTAYGDYSGVKKNDNHGEWTFTYRRDPSVSDAEFTLTAFGLPEPYFAPAQRTNTWLYLAAGALLAVVMAWLIGRRFVRRAA